MNNPTRNNCRSHIYISQPNLSRFNTVAILQPGYLPWLGFFNQMLRSDIFVIYDDVQYDKHGWRNRNRIKSLSGLQWLSVPVLSTGRHGQKINEVKIDNSSNWGDKHLRSIAHSYARAPHLLHYLPALESLLTQRWERLVDLDIALINLICRWLGIDPKIKYSSSLNIVGDKSERLLSICQHFHASHYLSGDSANNYLDIPIFEDAGIEIIWQSFSHPVYPQLHGDFMPYLSVIDLIMNAGQKSITFLEND